MNQTGVTGTKIAAVERLTPELWGGHECTVNRVGDRFGDQNKLTGHEDRLQDLERFAALGISRLRYPVLWERIAPSSLAYLTLVGRTSGSRS